MSQIHRPRIPGTARLDVSVLQEIESAFAVDAAPAPEVIAPLHARREACGWYDDDALDAEVTEACDGGWLELEEIHAIQRLRGWHRTRFGSVTVDAWWLAAVRNVLDNLTLALGDSCEDEFRQWSDPQAGDYAEWAAMIKSMIRTSTCGECTWCTALRLRDEIDAVLDAHGFEGGVYYRCYCLGQSVDEANTAVYGPDWHSRLLGGPRRAAA